MKALRAPAAPAPTEPAQAAPTPDPRRGKGTGDRGTLARTRAEHYAPAPTAEESAQGAGLLVVFFFRNSGFHFLFCDPLDFFFPSNRVSSPRVHESETLR